jgi:hypothetical protein
MESGIRGGGGGAREWGCRGKYRGGGKDEEERRRWGYDEPDKLSDLGRKKTISSQYRAGVVGDGYSST